MERKYLKFRTGLAQVEDASGSGSARLMISENGKQYDASSAGTYANVDILEGSVLHRNCELTIMVKPSPKGDKYLIDIVAKRENGKILKLVKLRESGYSYWSAKFNEKEPIPRQRIQEPHDE